MIKHKLGLLAEYIVAFYYVLRLFLPIKHRYKVHVGEIDLIMKRLNQIVFIEVKARKSGLQENIITLKQQQRITRAAELFLAQHLEYKHCNIRFDLVVVAPYSLPKIIKNAW